MRHKRRLAKNSAATAILSILMASAMLLGAIALEPYPDDGRILSFTQGASGDTGFSAVELGWSDASGLPLSDTAGFSVWQLGESGTVQPTGEALMVPMAITLTYGYSATASNAAEFKAALDNSFNLTPPGTAARIELTNDIYMGGVYSLNNRSGIVHIVSNGAPKTIFPDGANRHFRISSSSSAVDLTFYLDGVILDGKNTGGGFSLHNSNGSTLAIVGDNGAIIQNCHEEDGQGGFISSQGVDFTLEALTVQGCSSSSGGAIHCLDAVDAKITRVDFIGNKTIRGTVNAGRGGAIYTQRDSSCIIDTCRFEGNTAEANGGAVYLGAVGPNAITNSVFFDNRSGNDGGAVSCSLYVEELMVQNSTFHQNNADRNGGAFYLSATPTGTTCDVTMNNVALTNNRAASYGGGIYSNKSNINLAMAGGSSITGNSARYGGAIGVIGGGKAMLHNTTVDSNQADRDGGGFYMNYASLNMSGGSISNNTAQTNGGGTYFSENLNNMAIINGVQIQNNTAGNTGGGAYIAYAGNAQADRQFSAESISFGGNVAFTEPLLDVLSPTNTAINNAIFRQCTGMANGKFALNNYDVAYMGGSEQFKITYHLNGGEGTPPQDTNSYFSGQSAFILDGEGLTLGTRDFIGWTEEPENQSVQFQNGDYYQVLKLSNNTLYAVYAPLGEPVYRVTFDANGGEFESGTDIIQHRISGNMISRPDAPALNGYYLMDWYTEPAAISKWNFGTAITSDLTLYAGWARLEPDEYEVAFHTRGGSYVESQIVKQNEVIDADKADTIREGYSLMGWATEDGDAWSFNTPVTGSMHLYAVWAYKGSDVDDSGDSGGDDQGNRSENNGSAYSSSSGGSNIRDKLDRDTATENANESNETEFNPNDGAVTGNVNDIPDTGDNSKRFVLVISIVGMAAAIILCRQRKLKL